jgi:hypothetical protein
MAQNMAISPQLAGNLALFEKIHENGRILIVYIQCVESKLFERLRLDTEVTFAAKFMPQSDGYIASYQVEQALD